MVKMEYVNFYVSVPCDEYLKMETLTKGLKMSKNEFIIGAIKKSLKTSESKLLDPKKNAKIETLYNRNIEA